MNPQDDFENARKVFSFNDPTPSTSVLNISDVVTAYLDQIAADKGIYDIQTKLDADGTYTISMPLSLWQAIERD